MFLTGSNVLADNFGDPKGSQFSDLVVKFYVGSQAYEGTILTNLSSELADNQFEVAVRVPDTVPLGDSRIVLGRKQNEKVSSNPAEPATEVLYNSNSYRLENTTEYVFAAQWTLDKIAVLNASNPESVVATTSSSDLLIGNIAVGTDDRLDRARDLTVTSDGSRVYVPLEASGRVALVDPITRQQVDTKADVAGLNPIDLPSGATPRSIVIDPRDRYAYIADGKIGSNSIYVLDINPFSSTYHQVTQTITVGAAPNGLRQMAISSDGKKLFVTAPNGANSKIYAVNIDPKDRPSSPGANPQKWNQLIGTIAADEGVEGIASTVNPLAMTFTNSSKDSEGFGVLNITNNDPVSFAATTRYASLGLDSDVDYFDVNEGVSVTVLPDASYAFVVGRNNNTALFGQELPSVDGDPRAGSNIGIIKDPLTNPQLVAATRPIPDGFATDLVLSNDSKYLYASYPNLSGANGKVYVFDTEEFVKTVTNPAQFQIDAKGRGVGLPLFDSATARNATVADLSTVPIDNINPAVSLAADFQILTDANNQYTYGVPPGSKRAPVAATNSRGLAATPLDWLDLTGPGENNINDLTPTFEWEFDELPSENVEEVNLFLSVFDEGEGLLPWDEVVDLPEPNGNEFLFNQGLSKPEQLDLLTKPWNTSFYRSQENDFNPNRILTATWQRGDDGIGKWTLDGGQTFIEGTNTSFTLPDNLTLTAGQEYNWAVEAWNKNGSRNIEFGDFWTTLTDPNDDDDTFPSVTVLTHGFKPPFSAPFFDNPGIPSEFYQLGNSIANAGAEDNGLMMRYDLATGYWVPVNKYGAVAPDFPAGENPEDDADYLTKLESYIAPYLDNNQPLVLLNDWSNNNESAAPDSGFSEAVADTFFASLVQLDQLFIDENSTAKQGAIFNSPLHFVGFSRGTVVNSEIIQRLGTHFPEAGGKENSNIRDLQMTTLDPHDFDQPGLNVVTDNFGDFREPKVQVWENVTFADNYYQTVPDLSGGTVSPAGRDLPNLPSTEDGKTAPGLQFPREGWRSENPDATAPLLGEPDLSVLLGTNKDNPDYNSSRAGFTKETDPTVGIAGRGAVHGRVLSWYGGTSDLFPTNFPFDENLDANPLFRRRGDGYREPLFDKDFSFSEIANSSARVTPWYTPEHSFEHGVDGAPWEGIGTGWFYSVLGGGKELRPQTSVERIPVDFDNTYDARMRGDFAVPTLFNGNFDAVFNPQGLNRTIFSDAIPGWSLHNGETSASVTTNNLVDVNQLSATDAPALHAELDRIGVDRTQPNYALKLESGKSITHNRFVVPEWGNLRFDLHVPEAELKRGRSVLVTLSAADGSPLSVSSSINLTRANRTKGSYLADTQKIDYGIKGFETFQFEVPDNLRGQVATLKFEVVGGGTVYLDNAFFKSQHLLFGNPSDARNTTDLAIADKNNYLLEKAQFATAYDDSSKTPKWVSWQMNKKWLSDTPRSNSRFIEDPSIPESWGRIKRDDYVGSGYSKGHMTSSSQRTNSEKDNIATFLFTNVVPQHYDNNDDFRGEIPNKPAWASFDDWLKQITQTNPITENPSELYVVSGGYGSNLNPQRYSHNSRPGFLTVPEILTSKGINIPGWTWKVVLDLEQPGLTPATVTIADAATYGILTPNEVEPAHVPTKKDGSVGNNGDFPLPVIHPFNILLGLNLPDIQNKAAWRNWRTWQLTVNQIEDLTGLDFFSNIPDEIEEIIESEG
ncbi:DNA/RNA non-specific endonuclease [Tychonema sp. LEGE 07203]|uniref:DNA/RNA non-specific endonuclease n=1 Tax=Tychonema sp. LEGE 07203 TaxID=1828671 RepID=UPI0018800451|nr:DNA/RNA non-specific endonuclease [Tychonema sp. LEGE 07203]MBE9094429.1 DNA/RNA non-specific endonuclease [Tychonema sp. LEGE 07203]